MAIVKPDPYYLEGRQEGLHPKECDFLLKTFYRGVDEPTTPQFKKHMLVVYYSLTKTHPDKVKEIASNLIQKEILSLSPDGEKIRLTDFGCETFEDFRKRQEEWETKDIVSINEGKNEISISKGEKFKGIKSIKDIFSLAEKEIAIEDPFVGSDMFSLLYELHRDDLKIKILTIEKSDNKELKAGVVAYKAFKAEIEDIEMKFGAEAEMHDRIVIIDGKSVYLLSSSIKDLGKKDSTIRLLDDTAAKVRSFKEKWSKAKGING
jgi:hypothetical protein